MRCTGCPPPRSGSFCGIDEHEEEEHQHQHRAGVDDDLGGGQELRAEHDEDARGVEERQHQKDGGVDRILGDDHPDAARTEMAASR